MDLARILVLSLAAEWAFIGAYSLWPRDRLNGMLGVGSGILLALAAVATMGLP